ncbi:hypothetical protein ACFWFJ_24705, partial [Nocardia salmonicida]
VEVVAVGQAFDGGDLAVLGGDGEELVGGRTPCLLGHMPGLQEVAERLSGSYDTRVTVSLGKRKGKIVVEFGSVEDLERIVALMEQVGPETSL